ncbi:tRNA threonylcarbamoyl adenosine modification protein YjeE [Gulbenkiania indica]|uniref:tRNA threonylcarbamoyladenosine biosynthesis protein TsaE n=1 Tax=Gulbenkiania indica TaxID=375574 RepID=A0A0K6GSI9_9NEIS|nr:tRNA (adenosine(37)-N6)-threonylcarbamoyltransferase complex ATPase subunit type 1 TsaE [Gulbenkiania indica]CUA81680.1 tRNA threonylcarbamoyl adenosine modification protein YjeE [Gulbenkiania indica]
MGGDDNSVVDGYLKDEQATLALGATVARHLPSGGVIYLLGDLGAGKTTFTRGLLNGLGHIGRVKSPTYTLVETYTPTPVLTLHHFDLYRFGDPMEWEDAGFRDYFGPDTLCIVEWPEKAAGVLPPADLTLQLTVEGTGRHYCLTAGTPTGTACLRTISTPPAVG